MQFSDKEIDDQQEMVKVLQYRYNSLYDELIVAQQNFDRVKDLYQKSINDLFEMKQK